MTARHLWPLALVTLAACGGGGGDAASTVPSAERLLADGGPLGTRNLLGRPVPFVFAAGESVSSGAGATTGIGTIELVDRNTLVLHLPGQDPVTLKSDDRSGGFADATGRLFTLNDDASGGRFTLGGGGTTPAGFFEDRPVLGAFGHETPEGARPVRATYANGTFSTAFLARAGAPGVMVIQDFNSVQILAEFAGDGTIRGSLLNEEALVDFAGDGTADDRLFLGLTLDGRITPEGFDGTFAATGLLTPAGTGKAQNLDLRLTDPKVTGRFFGNAAESVAAVFGSPVTLVPPGGPREAGSLAGAFLAEQP